MRTTTTPGHGAAIDRSRRLSAPRSIVNRTLGSFPAGTDRRAVLRTAIAAAVVIPIAFFVGDRVVGGSQVAVFSLFGGFAVLLYAHLGGDRRQQVLRLALLSGAGASLIVLGTVLATPLPLAVAAMFGAAAVGIAGVLPLQHAFWIVLATLSALRPNAVGTAATALRATAGTVLGFVVGAGLVLAVGDRPEALWLLLPLVVLAAGFAPEALSFPCGQAAFTVVCVIAFNVLHPSGWIVGVARLEDVVVGGVVAVVVTLALRPVRMRGPAVPAPKI